MEFYQKYEDPVGPLLKSRLEDVVIEERFGTESKDKLKKLVSDLLSAEMQLVSVGALIDQVKHLTKTAFFDEAVDKIIEAKERGKFTAFMLSQLVDQAKQLGSTKMETRRYLAEVDKRIERRARVDGKKVPMLLIDPIDESIKGLDRGQLGLVMAPPSGGKGLSLIWFTVAYALQKLNVVHLSLEDPKSLVEDRLDASITGIPLNKLRHLPNRFKKRFKRLRKRFNGKIRLIDGTGDEEWTVTRLDKLHDRLCKEGFIPDAYIIDYDEYLTAEEKFKGDSARRMEFDYIYKRLVRFAAKHKVILWIAAQTVRKTELQKVITGKDVAEDFSKIRKAFMVMAIGRIKDYPKMRHLFIAKHRDDKAQFGVDILTDFDSAIFYDREATLEWARKERRKKE